MNSGAQKPTVSGSTAATLLAAAVLAGTAVLALGSPDMPSAIDFLTSGRPSREGALAAIKLLVWGLVAALLFAQLAFVSTRSRGIAHEMHKRRLRARATLAMGVLIFAGGVLNHQTPTGSICCGDISQADHNLP